MPSISEKFVDALGFRTHYYESGEGVPLVLLHSGEFGACAELSWEFNIGPLSECFRVLAPDWLGFGKSEKVFSFEDMQSLRIRHMAAFLKAIGVADAHFIGNSMGGGLLARAAVMNPPAFPVRKMVLAGAGGFAPRNEHRDILNSYDGSRAHMARCIETLVQRPKVRADEAYLDRRHELSLEPGAWECTAAARFKMPGRASSGGRETDFALIKFPTLIIAGRKDPLRNPGYAEQLQKDIEGSELVVLEDAGHCPQIDDPDSYNKAVIEFLGRMKRVARWKSLDNSPFVLL